MVRATKLTKAMQYIDNLSPVQEKVATILQENKELTRKELEELSKLSDSTITRCVTTLIQEGLAVETNKKRDKRKLLRWVGGVPALESELMGATSKRALASDLAEYYDYYVTDAFSLFSLLFDNNCWEIIVNLNEGLSDTELHQRLGKDLPLDIIRRVLVVCDAHNLIRLTRIREPSDSNVTTLFEPLFRIDVVNREYQEYLTLLRGLASALQFRMENRKVSGYSKMYEGLLEASGVMYADLKNKITSSASHSDINLINKIINNYDFAPDLDRVFKNENWRTKAKTVQFIKYDDNTDHILFDTKFIKNGRH